MYTDIQGLVIGEKKQGENGKLLTVLTPNLGVLKISTKGGTKMTSSLFASSQLFAYSDMTIYQKGNFLTLTEATVKDVFFELNEDLVSLSLACWICEVASSVSVGEEEQGEIFRLLLNSLWYLSKNPDKHTLIKAVFELRVLFLIGFCPELICTNCGVEPNGDVIFDYASGELFCSECAKVQGPRMFLKRDTYLAMKYVALCPPKRVFMFSVGDDDALTLSQLSERFLINMTGINTTKLDFYKNMI